MNKFLKVLFLFLLIFQLNVDILFAHHVRATINPQKNDDDTYREARHGTLEWPTHESTSVTIMWEDAPNNIAPGELAEDYIVPNACYLVGKAYNPRLGRNENIKFDAGKEWIKVDANYDEEIKASDDDENGEEDQDADTARAKSTGGNYPYSLGVEGGSAWFSGSIDGDEEDDWYEPFWVQHPEGMDDPLTPAVDVSGTEDWEGDTVNSYGWAENDFGRQAGGDLCGFVKNPIQGSGTDSPADYIRADNDGRLWLRNVCESFEGVRSDCTEKFSLHKRFRPTVFRVICGYYTANVFGQYQEDVANGTIDNGRIPDGDKRRNYQMVPDPFCDISKANYNDNGGRELQIFENGLWEHTFGRKISEKKLWAGAFKLVIFANTPPDTGAFEVSTFTSLPNFNPESNVVRTEFGDIPRDPRELASAVVRIALGVAGGVAFLLMVSGAFRLIFARGDPEAVQQGREVITAAIIGLLVIVFATFLLQLIGISILDFYI